MSQALIDKVKNYPFLIYKPYLKTLDEEDPQRKDHQRICLEMILSVNASICLANYHHLKTSGDDKQKDKLKISVKNQFKNNKDGELKYDLGQMSIGKWNQVSRDTSMVLLDATDNGKKQHFLIKEIGGLYKDKKWNDIVNDLISRRNADAHGGVLDDKILKKQLKERQDLLDQLIEKLSFFKDYKILVPIKEEIKEGGLVCRCNDLSNEGNGTFDIRIDSDDPNDTSFEHYNTYLYNENRKIGLSLEPMIISYNLDEKTEDLSTFIYNKTINRKKGDLHYANHRESLDLIRDNDNSTGSLPTPKELCQEFKAFRIEVEDNELVNRRMPNIVINRKFQTTTSLIGDDTIMELTFQNVGNADAKNVQTTLKYPQDGFVRYKKSGVLLTEKQQENDKVEITIEDLASNRSEKKKFRFKAMNGAQYHFDEMTLTYDYDDPDTGNEHTYNLEDGINVVSISEIAHQVIDPDDPQSQVPVINLQVTYKNHQNPEIKGHNPSLGDEIDFIVSAENIGNSIAHDVDIHIFPPPEEMDLISGSTSWRGNINPGEVIDRVFTLRPRKQGIFSMKMRDVLYTNEQGHLFKTLAYEDHKILVKNNPRFRYQFLLEDVWKDLTIDEDETLRLKKNAATFTKNINQEEKEKIEIDVKVRCVKKVVENVLNNTQLTIKQIAKDRMIGYCLEGYPFLIIDFRDSKNILILLKGNFERDKGLKQIGILTSPGSKKGLSQERRHRDWIGKYNDLTFYSISLDDIDLFGKKKKLGGAALLKMLTNKAVNYIDSHEALMIRFLKNLGDVLKLDNLFSRISFDKKMVKGKISNQHRDNIMIREIILFMNTKNSINLIVSRVSKDGLGPALEASENGGYNRWYTEDKDKGMYVRYNGKGMTNDIQLLSEYISGSTANDMESLISKLVIDLANVRATLDLKNLQKEHRDQFFPKLRQFIKEMVGPFHFRSESDKEGKEALVFYKGEDWPLYEKSRVFLKIQEEKIYSNYRIRISFRYLNRKNFNEFNKLQDTAKFNVDYNDYWFYSFIYDISSFEDAETIDSLLHEAIKDAYNSSSGTSQIITYGVLKQAIQKFTILEDALKAIDKEPGSWIMFEKVGKKIGPNLGKISQWINRMDLKNIMEIENRYKDPESKSQGRIKMTPGSASLINSVLE